MVARKPRWNNDERAVGVGAASAFRPALDTLRTLIDEAGWVAEEPEVHLLPHLESAMAADGSSLAIAGTATEPDGVFAVNLTWAGPDAPNLRELRAALVALVGAVAESVTTIHALSSPAGVELEVVTGTLPGDTIFASHGHTLRLRVAVPSLVRTNE
jgi:hypothetical protein